MTAVAANRRVHSGNYGTRKFAARTQTSEENSINSNSAQTHFMGKEQNPSRVGCRNIRFQPGLCATACEMTRELNQVGSEPWVFRGLRFPQDL